MADQVVRLLDDDGVTFPNRLRLIMQYLLYRDGLLQADTQKLLAHAQLPAQDGEVIQNVELLGANILRAIKETRPLAKPLFNKKEPTVPPAEESGLSRFDPAVKVVLEEQIRGSLDQDIFPFTKPHLDAAGGLMGQENVSQASLRSAKPTWARTRPSATGPKQRIIIFIAGGATYSESRACYEISEAYNRDAFLVSSHMLTPSLYLRQLGDLSVDRRQLNLPADRPKPKAPDHLFENNTAPPPPAPPKQPTSHSSSTQLPAARLQALSLNSNEGKRVGSTNGAASLDDQSMSNSVSSSSKSVKREKDRDAEKKRKHHFFGSKR